jgi:molybdenum cofactor biosynthesis enzyme MoaA
LTKLPTAAIDLSPEEIAIELTPFCNFDCPFCFNRNSFAAQHRNIGQLTTDQIYTAINQIATLAPAVKLTGGEPLLRKDIVDIARYAHSKGLDVRLNTNGTLLTTKKAKELAPYVHDVLI